MTFRIETSQFYEQTEPMNPNNENETKSYIF